MLRKRTFSISQGKFISKKCRKVNYVIDFAKFWRDFRFLDSNNFGIVSVLISVNITPIGEHEINENGNKSVTQDVCVYRIL